MAIAYSQFVNEFSCLALASSGPNAGKVIFYAYEDFFKRNLVGLFIGRSTLQ